MTALLIIAIVLCGLALVFDFIMLFAGDDELGVIGVVHMIPLIIAIVALSVAL